MKIDPESALSAWGCAQHGRLRAALVAKCRGEGLTEDFEATIARQVEPFFNGDAVQFRSLATWVHAHGEPPSLYRWREPGETKLRALLRQGWAARFAVEPVNLDSLYADFRREFEGWWDARAFAQPMTPPVPVAPDPDRLDPLTAGDAARVLGKTVGATNNLLARGALGGWKHAGRWWTNILHVRAYQARARR